MPSLRIVYDNLVDVSTLSANVTDSGTDVNNLKSDIKSKVWRSTGKTGTITITFGGSRKVSAIALPFCNLTSAATIQVTANGSTNLGTFVPVVYKFDDLYSYQSPPAGISEYYYGRGTYGRIWLNSPATSYSSITLTISDTSNSSNIELSRLIIGEYWAPKYNTSYGLSYGMKDLSKHDRTEAGDLITLRGPRYGTLSFDLKYMDTTDRTNVLKIMKQNGLAKPMFVSLFPQDSDPVKEVQHQIYGKLSQLSPIAYPFLDMYSTGIDLEEI